MTDYFYRFDDRASMLAALEPLGMLSIRTVQVKDSNGEPMYATEKQPAYNWDYLEDGTPNFSPKLDENGDPIMEDVQVAVFEDVVCVSQGTHQYAACEVGELQGYTGWHLNVRVIDESFDVSSLNQYIVHPTNPKCIWA